MSFLATQKEVIILLSNRIYEIPRNQRKYVWTEEHWQELLSDLKFIIETGAGEKKHFLGSIVLKKEKQEPALTHYTIIDGQQRTITILLLLSMMTKIFGEKGMDDDYNGLKQKLIVTDLKNQRQCVLSSDFHTSIKEIVKASCDEGNKNISLNVILEKCIKDKSRDISIKKCCLFFYETFCMFDEKTLRSFRDALVSTNYVEIEASNDEDSYTIFEILNARGQTLEDHEMVKNFVMRYIMPKDLTDEVKRDWELIIDGRLGNTRNISRFFKHYTIHKYQETAKKSVYKVIISNVSKDAVKDFLNDILLKAGYYETMLYPAWDGDKANCTKEEYKILNFFLKKNVFIFRPAMLSLMSVYKLGIISYEDYVKALKFLYYFYICYNVIGEKNSNEIDEIIRKYSYLIEKNRNLNDINNFEKSLLKRLPNEEAFIMKFCNIGWSNHHKFYATKKNKETVQLILELIEKKLSGAENVNEFTIEHIKPDNEEEENSKIGNLLPLEQVINQNCKDLPIGEKIVRYEMSNFASARGFARRYGNGKQEFKISKRSEAMAKQIYDEVKGFMVNN